MRKLIVLGVVGLIAQLIDGSLGMAYGVTSSTLLLAAGVAPAAASAAVHFSEIGTSLVSGASHHKLGNVDWRTVSILAVPGFVGAFLGATLLSNMDAAVAKPVVAVILLSLGFYVVYRFLRLGGARPTFKGHPSAMFLAPMGLVAGTLDAVGGGGWGPVGTTSLLSSGRLEPRKVVGSIDTSEFVVAVGGSLGFLIGLGAAGHQLGLRRRAARRWRHRRPDRRLAGQAPRRPRPRHRRRWPDHPHQLQDAPRGRRRPRCRRRRHRRGRLRPLDRRHRLGGQAGAPLEGRGCRRARARVRPRLTCNRPTCMVVRRRSRTARGRRRTTMWPGAEASTTVFADISDKLHLCASPPKPTMPSGP